jgi:hypothetical protein
MKLTLDTMSIPAAVVLGVLRLAWLGMVFRAGVELYRLDPAVRPGHIVATLVEVTFVAALVLAHDRLLTAKIIAATLNRCPRHLPSVSQIPVACPRIVPVRKKRL